ncbi:ABC transporter sub-family A-like protein 3 [Leptotrombidium deliense]|uniref:ABC transporter sub-family A-like protein 3 n=1 Tax=Leptotrombidium deliense TaxID=299467 RepID=A0A443SNG7_9ACAR|nr:ABC transporter sub-family A-like protein 3 [Leptotrombidium deliense]
MQKFRSLLKKCILVKIRKPLETLVIFIMPIFVASLSLYPPLFKDEDIVKTSDSIFDIKEISKNQLPTDEFVKLVIRYFPSNQVTDNVMRNVNKMVNDINFDVIAYKDEDELQKAMKPEHKFIRTKLMLFQINYNFFNKFYNFFRSFIKKIANKEAVNETLAIVEFHGMNWQQIPKHFEFTVTSTSFTETSNFFGSRSNASIPYESKSYEKRSEKLAIDVNSDDTNPYIASNFAYIMHLVNTAYLSILSNKTQTVKISALKFPYKRQLEYDFVKGTSTKIIGFCISIGFCGFCICIVKEIVEEKAIGLKSMMGLMGMDSLSYYTSHFFCNIMIALLQSYILSQIYTRKIGSWPIVEHADTSLIFFILFVYIISITLYSMAISTAFDKDPHSAVFAVAMLQMVFDTIVNLVFKRPSAMGFDFGVFDIPESLHLFSALAPHSAIKLMFEVIEFNQQYANYCLDCDYGTFWSNFFVPPPAFKILSIGLLTFVSLFSSSLFILIIIYSSDSKSQTKCQENDSSSESVTSDMNENCLLSEQQEKQISHFEKLPVNFKVGITIENVCKNFGNKAVVKNISLQMCKGEITGLLGHNGAGKSTLINMITGRLVPSKGNIRIFDADVVSDTETAFRYVGYCPQFDTLYESLTIKQHLRLFCAIKGLKGEAIEKEVRKFLALLNIYSKKDEKVKHISGGLKRRLSLGRNKKNNVRLKKVK